MTARVRNNIVAVIVVIVALSLMFGLSACASTAPDDSDGGGTAPGESSEVSEDYVPTDDLSENLVEIKKLLSDGRTVPCLYNEWSDDFSCDWASATTY